MSPLSNGAAFTGRGSAVDAAPEVRRRDADFTGVTSQMPRMGPILRVLRDLLEAPEHLRAGLQGSSS